MRKSHSLVLIALFIAAIAGTALADSSPAAPSGVVNINTADVTQLAYLPRVGAKAAQRIIDYRTQHGGFRSLDDLDQVSGFGPARMAALRGHVAL